MNKKTELHELLIRCIPEGCEQKNIHSLAQILGTSPQSLYKWLRKNRIPPSRVTSLIEASNFTIDINEILPFVV